MQPDLQIEIHRRSAGLLQVHVRGETTFANTQQYWHAIAAAVETKPAHALLLVDELTGPGLTAPEWVQLVGEVGPRLGRLRIAHVKPNGPGTVEHCVLAAISAGMEARVFEDARMASLWLRYGPVDA